MSIYNWICIFTFYQFNVNLFRPKQKERLKLNVTNILQTITMVVLFYTVIKAGLVAQMMERVTCNLEVASSIPGADQLELLTV